MEDNFEQRDENQSYYEKQPYSPNGGSGSGNPPYSPNGGVGSGSQPSPPRNSGFGKGVLTGVLCTLAVVLVAGGIAAGIFLTANMTKRVAENRVQLSAQEDQAADKASGIEETDSSEQTEEGLLNVDLISEVSMIASYLDQYYLYDVDEEAVRTGMLQGLVAALGDPYAEYYDESAFSSFQDSNNGEYVGIGAGVTQERESGIVRISKPYEGTPSAEAGLLPGDILVAVDDTEVTGMDLNRVVALIKGDEGTSVMLHLYRESEERYLDLSVERRKVELPTVTSELLEGKIGYIQVSGFESVTTNQFIAAYEELKSRGMERVVVDLRNNGGGLVDVVEAMLDYLLPEGEILYAKDKNGTKTMEYVSDAKAALDIPMVVLVNGNTASASEIFSGNIQAFGKGKVVGTTTYGKGVMQQVFYTNTEHTKGVKLTIADYYIYGDKNVNGTGITPDVEVELDEEAAKKVALPKEEDNQLQKALEVVKGME